MDQGDVGASISVIIRIAMVYVKKKNHETTPAMLRRFTRMVQQSGVLMQARKNSRFAKLPNKVAKKRNALRRITRRKERERMAKLGRLVK